MQSLAIVDFAFLLPQMHTTTAAITPEQLMTGQKYSFLAIPIWGLAMTFIKVSIAMTLLRIQPNNLWWRIFCGFIMFILSAYGSYRKHILHPASMQASRGVVESSYPRDGPR